MGLLNSQVLGRFETHVGPVRVPFFVAVDHVKPVALTLRRHGKQTSKGTRLAATCLAPGPLAHLRKRLHGSFVHSYVYIMEKVCEVNAKAVSASLDECLSLLVQIGTLSESTTGAGCFLHQRAHVKGWVIHAHDLACLSKLGAWPTSRPSSILTGSRQVRWQRSRRTK